MQKAYDGGDKCPHFFITKMQFPCTGTCEYKCSAERRELDTLQLVQIEVSDCEGDRLMMPHCLGQI